MFPFSTDRLAGLDTMVLKITSPKVPTIIPNDSLHHGTYAIKKLKKQYPHREARPPLGDKTASNNLVPRPPDLTSSVILHALSTAGEVMLHSPNDSSSPRVPCSPDIPSFRPLPPLPSASTLQLPSFLNFSTHSLASLADPPASRSAASLPASDLFRVSPSPVASSSRVAACEAKSKVVEGPQWIPAFHHPNSPYVPWSSPVRRRILPPPSPPLPSPVCFPSPCVRSGAVAPEPWASCTFSQVPRKSGKERLSNSWKSFKNSIKKGARTVVSNLGKCRKSVKALCMSQDALHAFDDTDAGIVVPDLTSNVMRPILTRSNHASPRDSLASFVSSDSRTLVAWLAERHASAVCPTENMHRVMSVEEYELVGSWLDLRRSNGGWVCGVQNCDTHTPGGSPCAASEYLDGLRTVVPSDSAGLSSVPRLSPAAAFLFPSGAFSASPRFHSLPRLPFQSLDVHSTREARPATPNDAERCLTRYRELSMPGGWTFT